MKNLLLLTFLINASFAIPINLLENIMFGRATSRDCTLILVDVAQEDILKIQQISESRPMILVNSMSMNNTNPLAIHIARISFCALMLVQDWPGREIDLSKLQVLVKQVKDGRIYLVTDKNISSNIEISKLEVPTTVFTVQDKITETQICFNYPPLPVNSWNQSQVIQRKTYKCPNPMNGQTYNVTGFGVSPFAIYNKGGVLGVDKDLLQILGQKFNFKITAKWGKFFGSKNPETGVWNGAIGDVASGKVDFAIGGFSATDISRWEVVHFSAIPYSMHFHFCSASPKPVEPYFNILKPFDIYSWFLIIIYFVLVTLFGYLINRMNLIAPVSKLNVSFLPYRAIIKQGTGFSIQPLKSGQFGNTFMILFGFWLFFTLIISSAFSGNLNAFLVAVDYEAAVNTGSDILNMKRTLYLPIRSALYNYVAKSVDPTLKQLYKEVYKREGLYRIAGGWIPTETENGIFQTGGVLIWPKENVLMRSPLINAKHGNNVFYVSKQPLYESRTGIVMAKYSPDKKWIDPILERMVSMGIPQGIINSYYPKEASVGVKKRTQFTPITLRHIFGPLIVLGSIFFLALLFLVVELIEKKN